MTVKVITTKRGIPTGYIPMGEIRKTYGDQVAQNLSNAVYTNGLKAVKVMKTVQGPRGGTSRGRVYVDPTDFAGWMQRTPHPNQKYRPELKPEHGGAKVEAQPEVKLPINTDVLKPETTQANAGYASLVPTVVDRATIIVMQSKLNALMDGQRRTEAMLEQFAQAWGLNVTRQ
jgi:hypothetical protein